MISPNGEFDKTPKNSYIFSNLTPNFSSGSSKHLFRLKGVVYLFVLKKLEVWNGRDCVQVGEFL